MISLETRELISEISKNDKVVEFVKVNKGYVDIISTIDFVEKNYFERFFDGNIDFSAVAESINSLVDA